jgi:type III pantothenate kinase
MNTLCLDFGNTRLKAAVFCDNVIAEVKVLDAHDTETLTAIVDTFRPEKSILASVINHDEKMEQLLKAHTTCHVLRPDSKLNFRIAVSKRETIGPDRLALAAAAVEHFPGKNNLIIGMGSCITYNFINHQHEFLGGAIAPGMEMRFRAMHEFTAKLPLATPDHFAPLIGYDTKTNLQSGVIHGITNEIKGFADAYSQKFGNFNAVLTGGDSPYFAGQLKSGIFADPYLLFKGLYALSQINN